MKFGICFREGKLESAKIVRKILDNEGEVVEFEEVGRFHPVEADIFVAVGGDGTVIRCSKIVMNGSPIVGIKAGRLGFLSSYTLDDLEQFVEDLKEMAFIRESRMMAEAEINGQIHLALNDVVVQKDIDGRMLEIEVIVGGESPLWFFADGLIVSTPTGSTAYNLSAGGPVVYPFCETLQITPILPHFLFNRGIVVPDTKDIRVFLDSDTNVLIDGKRIGKFSSVTIRKSSKSITILRSPKSDFFKIVKDRIGYGRRLI
jgi:NAD+ kinase